MQMALIQVRDVPESQLTELKARAAAAGQSLNSFMRELIRRETASPTVAEVLRRAADRTESASASAVEIIGEARIERGAVSPTLFVPDPSAS